MKHSTITASLTGAVLAAATLTGIAASGTQQPAPRAGATTTATTTVASAPARTDANVATTATATMAPSSPTRASGPVSVHLVAATSDHAVVSSGTTAARDRYLKRMYAEVVPARERAKLAGHYVFGYNLPGMACGTGCSGLFAGQARSSFDASFFEQPLRYQRNILAHEAAHAYGFLYIRGYTTASWARAGGWQTQFHHLDRQFVGTYDAEAWASCVAWRETGFNNRVIEISSTCTSAAGKLALSRIV